MPDSPETTSKSTLATPSTPPPMTEAQAAEALKAIKPEVLKAKLLEVRTWYNRYHGKVGCNPHTYLFNAIRPLEDKLKAFDLQPFSSQKEKLQFVSDLVVNVAALQMDEKFAVCDREAYDAELARQEELKRRRSAGPQAPGIAVGGI